MAGVPAVPEGYPSISVGLAIDGAAEAIEFYKTVFGAIERMRMPGPNQTVMHCELLVGDSVLMIGDSAQESGFPDPKAVGGTPVDLYVYVPDVEEAFSTALEGGATNVTPLADQFYGDRTGSFIDPWGHRWTVATHVEDVDPEEMQRRMTAMMAE